MKELVPGIHPPGGFKYVGPDGTPFEAGSLPDLVQAVWAYRRRNKLPEGNVFREVQEYLCEKHAGICRDVPEPLTTYAETPESKALVQSVVQSASNWLDEKLHGRLKFVDLKVATPRVTSCAGCPARKNWWSLCGRCRENTGHILEAVRRPQLPMRALEGEACTHFGDDLSVAVFIYEPPTKSNVPKGCWRKSNP